jgi:hypothetical protein
MNALKFAVPLASGAEALREIRLRSPSRGRY